MDKLTRNKNGCKMVVESWSNKIQVIDKKTNKIIKVLKFADHIQAVLAVKNV